jgi:hypothetical protein
MPDSEQKLDPFSFAASRPKRSPHAVFVKALRPLGNQGEIEMAIALTLKKCGQLELPTELPMLRALLYGPLLSTLKSLFDAEAARPAVEHLHAELKVWAKEEDPSASGVRDIPANRPTRTGAIDVREESGERTPRGPVTPARKPRERKQSGVAEEQVVQGHRDFSAPRRQGAASDQRIPAAASRLDELHPRTSPPPPGTGDGGLTGPPPAFSEPTELDSVLDASVFGDDMPSFSGSASSGPAITAPPTRGPAVTSPPDSGREWSDLTPSGGSARPKRRTIPTPIQMLPPVLVLSTEHGLGFRIRAALQEQADVTVFTDAQSLLAAAGNLLKLDPIVLLDGRDDARVALVQEALAFAPEELRVVMWGWIDEDFVVDGGNSRRVRCDLAVEPEDLGALIQALVTARVGEDSLA